MRADLHDGGGVRRPQSAHVAHGPRHGRPKAIGGTERGPDPEGKSARRAVNGRNAVNAMTVAPIVLVCGSRSWTDPDPIRRRLAPLPATAIVLHGDAPGADRLAGRLARERGLHVAAMPALWERNGKAAGVLRNAAMLRMNPYVVIAFWDGRSSGTRNTLDLARAAGVPVDVVLPNAGA